MKQHQFKVKTVSTLSTGKLGEDIAEKYLIGKGYSILERNVWRKWGEIDIVALKDKRVIFVEVKAVSYETREMLHYAVTHETWRPEEQVHHFKLRQIQKALETWISEHDYQGDWQIDVLAIRIVPRETYATVGHIDNVILS
jgi:putative endonuclease